MNGIVREVQSTIDKLAIRRSVSSHPQDLLRSMLVAC